MLAGPCQYKGGTSVLASLYQDQGIASPYQYRGLAKGAASPYPYTRWISSLSSLYPYTRWTSSLSSLYPYTRWTSSLSSPYQYIGKGYAFASPYQYIGNRLSFSEALSAAKDKIGNGLSCSEAYLAARGKDGFPAYGLWLDGSYSNGTGAAIRNCRRSGTTVGNDNRAGTTDGMAGNSNRAGTTDGMATLPPAAKSAKNATGVTSGNHNPYYGAMGSSHALDGYLGNGYGPYYNWQPSGYGATLALLSPQVQARLESAIGTGAVEALPELLQEMQEHPESAKDMVGQWVQLFRVK